MASRFSEDVSRGMSSRAANAFCARWRTIWPPISRVETAEFEIVGIEEIAGSASTFDIDIRYDLVGTRNDSGREQRVGHWLTRWSRDEAQAGASCAGRQPKKLSPAPASRSSLTSRPRPWARPRPTKIRCFAEWTTGAPCWTERPGSTSMATTAWRWEISTTTDSMIFTCANPRGFPTASIAIAAMGAFEDVTEASGVAVLDDTACALFADFENKGVQDLLVVCGSGPLLFLNQGNGKIFAQAGRLQICAACLREPSPTPPSPTTIATGCSTFISVFTATTLGLDQYHYPVPYFDARNGPPNFLLHNEGNATFTDRTEAAGLNVDNDRYSFACAWGDLNSDGSPDLYVANDFGRSNLYRNNGDGTFTSVSTEAGVEDAGAGMSACWFDFDNDGNQDIYVANMWSAAGLRVSEQKIFHEKDPENIRALYRGHARGNSLYRNQGNGKFQNVSGQAGAEMGRWAWSSDAWDFDHDGYP